MTGWQRRDTSQHGDPVVWRRVELWYRRVGANAAAAVLVAAGPFLVFVSAHRLYLALVPGRWRGWRVNSPAGVLERWGMYALAVAACTGVVMLGTASGLRCVIRALRRLSDPAD